MAQPILPFALPLVVCDGYESAAAGKLDIVGSFHTIRPLYYPHVHDRFCVVGHLTGGMGSVTFHLDIRNTETGELVYCTNPHSLRIASRKTLVRLANSLEGVTFSLPGIYLIELYCENAPIADFRLELIEVEENDTEELP